MELIVVDTRSGRRRNVPAGWESLVLGSGFDCDVVLPEPEIANRFCRATATSEGVALEALAAAGFDLNGRSERAAILRAGDVVRIGPFQIVVRGEAGVASAPPLPRAAPPPPPAAPPRLALSADELAAPTPTRSVSRANVAAAHRRRSRRFSTFLGLVVLGGAGWGGWEAWQRGLFGKAVELLDSDGGTKGDRAKRHGDGSSGSGANGDHGEPTDSNAAASEPSGAPLDPVALEAARPRGRASTEDVDKTLAKIDRLLEAEEYARCRWLLYTLDPVAQADRARVDKRRAEVDTAALAAGQEHLALVDRLVENGKILGALGNCEDTVIQKFRGLEAWYRLRERADAIEEQLDKIAKENRTPRATVKRRHALLPMPADVATRPPPPIEPRPIEAGVEDDLVAAARNPLRPSSSPPPSTSSPSDSGGSTSKPPTDSSKPPTLSVAELAEVRRPVVAALSHLAAARGSAVEPALKKLVDAAHEAKSAAAEPLLTRANEIADALEKAPERAALTDLHHRVETLAAARKAALDLLFDPARYLAFDPKAAGDASRPEAVAAAQKGADQVVDAVRDVWGNEQGGSPQPVVTLSDETFALGQQARTIDALLADLGAASPARADFLATRLLPSWTNKVTVRNLAADVDDHRRLEADHDVEARNQLVKSLKESDELALVHATNSYRAMFGRPQLVFDRALYDDARSYCDLISQQQKNAKESDPQPPSTPRVAGPKPSGGTNCLRGHFTARQVLEKWTKSAAAHRNLLDQEHRTVAVGKVNHFWAQLFGLLERPESSSGR